MWSFKKKISVHFDFWVLHNSHFKTWMDHLRALQSLMEINKSQFDATIEFVGGVGSDHNRPNIPHWHMYGLQLHPSIYLFTPIQSKSTFTKTLATTWSRSIKFWCTSIYKPIMISWATLLVIVETNARSMQTLFIRSKDGFAVVVTHERWSI